MMPFDVRVLECKPRVLVVDDDLAILRALARMIGREFEVHAASTTAEAASMLATTGFVAVISDYDMPGDRDGLYVLARARELQPSARRVLHTGSDPHGIRLRGESWLVEHLLSKPASKDELLATLSSHRGPPESLC
ncbi:MAG: response regulator [Deltaproteobacteria bacterium]|nr:response regulator [Deltaproteobacteria bacterium]